MHKSLALVALLGAVSVAGCTQNINPTDTDRALIGAGAGALIADLAGESPLAGAAIGAGAGALCNDARLCE
ncbi:YMGG-like glycine zipper-containing protein [Paracoccus spongiarum]|uniref:YMGG-like glycine zipper-containing protein n=1 Tax=Paracoccus spongiarum TaxID=3064387 RepID=A0ABT9JDU5_9RHOB|nr:YMGG-like glycine zipper-containing protein [Paracoccus sp. 2205BS29-5]MDP5308001.1 YMGG-like glycine zipper-containing protein [Paracoccus sp. 2205BS29-5]